MTLEDYTKRMDGVVKDLQAGAHAAVMVRMAITAATLCKTRVQETGTDANGKKYDGYSTKRMYASKDKFVKKAAFKTVNGHKTMRLDGGYKEFREIQTRRTDITNFSFTNLMWNNIMPDVNKATEKDLLSSHQDHINGIAIIGAKRDLDKKKLSGNTERFGDILDISESEKQILMKSYNLDVLQIFRNNGL
jgi:hypothetical protein